MANAHETASAAPTMRLHFAASLTTVEGVLAMVQKWCAEQGVPRDGTLSVRLVLEELLTNICLHAQLPPHNDKVELQLDIQRPHADGGVAVGEMHITLSDAGPAFNPPPSLPVRARTCRCPPAGRGSRWCGSLPPPSTTSAPAKETVCNWPFP